MLVGSKETIMRQKHHPNFSPRCLILLFIVLLIPACATKLIDVDKSISRLGLSQEQSEVVVPRVESIKNIAEEYDAKLEELEQGLEEMRGGGGMREGGGRPSGGPRGEFADFRKQREVYLSAINTHIAEIKAVLNEEQLAAFSKMKMPELAMPEMPGRGGRGGGGRGGMGGGGMF